MVNDSNHKPDFIEQALAEVEEMNQRGEYVVGGAGWQMNRDRVALQYADAARWLIERGSAPEGEGVGTVALPIIYLQRHAAELMLKKIARSAVALLECRRMEAPKHDFDREHDLEQWLQTAEGVLAPTGYQLPAEVKALINLLRSLGDTNGENWRYGYVRRQKKGPAEYAFTERVLLPLKKVQALLDDAITCFADEHGIATLMDAEVWEQKHIVEVEARSTSAKPPGD